MNNITNKVNCVLNYVISDSISDTNKLIKAAAIYIYIYIYIYMRTDGIKAKTGRQKV